MADTRSIRMRVLDDVEAALRDWGALPEHHHRMVSVERFRVAPPDPTRLPACAFYAIGDMPAPEGRFLPYEYRFMTLVIEAWVARPTQQDALIDELTNELLEDCYRVMMRDPQRGGWALDTLFESAGVLVEEGVVGIQANFLVKYRFLHNDPAAPVPEGMV